MFDIHGDEITFEGIKVGLLNAGWPSVQHQAREALREWKDPDTTYEEGWEAGEENLAPTIRELQAENDALAKRVAELEAELDAAQRNEQHGVAGDV